MTVRAVFLTIFALVSLGASSTTPPVQAPESEMLGIAQKFLDTLSPEQAAQATIPFNSAERYNWFYTPVDRKGLPFKSMDDAQQKVALELLRAGFSEKGYDKAETIRQLELVLFEMSGRTFRDTGLYYFTFFGEPSERGPWGWRYEGHHISQHWTIVNGTAVAASPQFFGTNPAEVRDGPKRGQRVLGSEEDQARSLLASLNASQRASAMLSDEAPRDILTSSEREVAMLDDLGVSQSDLTSSQQAILWSIIEEYATAQPATVANQRLDEVREAGLTNIKFGWMGGAERGEPHYYRIQGPTFLIEYDNTQGNANHVHSVWRDFRGDFGRDLLAMHYRRFQHDEPVNAGE